MCNKSGIMATRVQYISSMWRVVVVKSIDYDVDLDFLLDFPEPLDASKTPTDRVESESDDSVSVRQNGSLVQSVTVPSNCDMDCIITPDRTKPAMVAARSTKVPSIDRSTKPSSASTLPANTASDTKLSLINNAASDVAVNGNQPMMNAVAHSKSKPTDRNVDPTDKHSVKSHGASVDITPRSSFVPPAPDRSTKPVISSLSDTNVHSVQLEREQAELSRLQAKKMQEATDLANLLRERRKLEMEMERKRQQLADADSTQSVSRIAIQSMEHKRVLEQSCHQSHLSVCLSVCQLVCPTGYCDKTTNWVWMPFGVVSGVGRGMGVLDGGWRLLKGKGQFGSKCGSSHYNQLGGDAPHPKLLYDFLL